MTFGPHVAPTPPSSDSSDRIATTAFTHGAIAVDLAADFSWLSYIPVYGAQTNSSAVFQSAANGFYVKVGTWVTFQAQVSSTNVGAATGYASITTPVPIANTAIEWAVYGRENSLTAKMLAGLTLSSNAFAVTFYDGTSPVAAGNVLSIQATYQST